jgi:hypothetical protein
MKSSAEAQGILHYAIYATFLLLSKRKLCIFETMETTAKPSNNHMGRKISRIRELRGIKQETLLRHEVACF